jgi:hypothetical protein
LSLKFQTFKLFKSLRYVQSPSFILPASRGRKEVGAGTA